MQKSNKPPLDDDEVAIQNSKPIFDIIASKLVPKDKVIVTSTAGRHGQPVVIENLSDETLDETLYVKPSGYKVTSVNLVPADDLKESVFFPIAKQREEMFMQIYRWPSKCPVINTFILKERNEYNFAVNYVKEYAEMNNVSIDVAAARIVVMPNLDNSIKKHIVKLFEDKAF